MKSTAAFGSFGENALRPPESGFANVGGDDEVRDPPRDFNALFVVGLVCRGIADADLMSPSARRILFSIVLCMGYNRPAPFRKE